MLELQKFLRNNDLQDLKTRFAIDFRPHNKYPNLFSFKYNQIESDFSLQIVREARGIILDRDDNWNVVSFPFTKFFNYGEKFADEIDWNSARIQEKMDGSLLILAWYKDKWNVSTSGSPDASGSVTDLRLETWNPRPNITLPIPKSFEEYFYQVINLDFNIFETLNCYKEYTFMFELTGPLNKIVVNNSEAKLTVIGARNKITGEEITAKLAADMLNGHYDCVKEFPFSNLDEILKATNELKPKEQEGFVVVDKNFKRIKIKSPKYVQLHHLKSSFSLRNCTDLVRQGESEEMLAYFPEYSEMIKKIDSQFKKLIVESNLTFSKIREIETQKDFAREALKYNYSSLLFKMRSDENFDLKKYLTEINIDTLIKML
jgi:hypothetical protein